MLLLLLIAIFALAFLVGVIGNISGVGGGVMIVLLLVYGFSFDPLDAAGLSLLTLVFSTLVGFIQDIRRKLVNKGLLYIIAPIGVITAVIGSVITDYVSANTFKGAFSVILISLGLFSVYSSNKQRRYSLPKRDIHTAINSRTGIVSLLAGTVSGFIGIGIGGMMGTYLTAIKRIDARTAIATVIAATLPITIAGAGFHFYLSGGINLEFAPPLVLGAVLGGLVGASIIVKAPHLSLRFLQGYLVLTFGFLSALLYLLTVHLP